MKLDHATIVTDDLEAARHFLCAVVGLSEGPRPPFGASGHWLYADGEPVIHLIGRAPVSSSLPSSTRIDHIGLRIHSAQEWSALLERMQGCGIPYEISEVPLTGERQLFLAMAPGVVIELVSDQQALAP
ncbi:MAG: hypothetical protein JWR16_1099 [Nevskia sp.]|nr:hypothetical protein [Nevskia sp.]